MSGTAQTVETRVGKRGEVRLLIVTYPNGRTMWGVGHGGTVALFCGDEAWARKHYEGK